MKRKKILFVGPIFYFYHSLIISKLQNLNYDVLFFEERFYGWKHLLFQFLGKRVYSFFSKKRYSKFFKELNSDIDILFVIRGESLPIDFIDQLKIKNPGIKTILYEWDSLKNINYEYLIKHFDKVVTFDKKDSEVLKIDYKPLFYTDDCINIDTSIEKDIDILFISTFLPERLAYLNEVEAYARENNLTFEYYLYITKFSFLKEFIFNHNRISKFKIHFKPLPKYNLIKKYERAKNILDVCNANQTGLSMRVIEMIGAGKKIITTNKLLPYNINIPKPQYLIIDSVADLNIDFIRDNSTFNCSHHELYISNWLKNLIEE